MRVLIAGAGVIGTVYGAHLGAAGHAVSVLRHPPRTDEVAARGLAARDVLDGSRVETGVKVVPDAAAGRYDLVLVTVRADQLVRACARLTGLADAPTVLFFGNNPGGATGRRPCARRPGELCFAAHARHAQAEMRGLGDQVTASLASTPATSHLYQLLKGSGAP